MNLLQLVVYLSESMEGFEVPPAGLEPTTPGLGILCSIHLSYGGVSRALLTRNFCRLLLYLLPSFAKLGQTARSLNFSSTIEPILELFNRTRRIVHSRVHSLAKPVRQHAQPKHEYDAQLFSAGNSGSRYRDPLRCRRCLRAPTRGARIRQSR